ISPVEIEAIIGPIHRGSSEATNIPLKSPGLLARHYAPKTPLECVGEDNGRHVHRLRDSGLRLGRLTHVPGQMEPGVKMMVLPSDPKAYAAAVYAALHELDAAGLDRIIVTFPPFTEEWLAVRDRLERAART